MTVLQVSSDIEMKKVLFVCTGNTCRSPMAEAIFNSIVDNDEYKAFSCGIYGDGSSPISENAKLVLAEKGIESSHVSTPLSESAINEADFVIGMTSNHSRNIISMFPLYADKVYTMPFDISDPYGGNVDVYRNCRNEIEECVVSVINTLKGNNNV